MFARVSIDLGAQQNVVVPDRAVVKQSGSGNKYVYVLSDGRVSYRKVTLGQRFDTTYELLDGIEDGDTVVITGQTASCRRRCCGSALMSLSRYS